MAKQVWLHTPEDMTWLQDVHGAPADMSCAILDGNEDSPDRIEAWREFNPDYRTAPDWIYEPSEES